MTDQSTEVTSEVTTPKYFRYKYNAFFVFTAAMEATDNTTVVEGTSLWAPYPAATGMDSYFTGHGWIQLKAFSLLTDEVFLSANTALAELDLQKGLVTLQGAYPDVEVSTWPRQEADAIAYLAGSPATAFLSTLAASTGETVVTLAPKIVAKANAYNTQYANLLGVYKTAITNVTVSDTLKQKVLGNIQYLRHLFN